MPALPQHVRFLKGGRLIPAPQPLSPLLWGGGDVATLSAPPQVPFTYIDYESNGKLWPGIHQMFSAVERFQVVNSYGLFRRMTGVGGRPEVVLEGSYDKQSWTVSAHLAAGEWDGGMVAWEAAGGRSEHPCLVVSVLLGSPGCPCAGLGLCSVTLRARGRELCPPEWQASGDV